MQFPQLVVLALDDWLGRQLQELTASRRWLLRQSRQLQAAMKMLSPPRPTILIAQLDPRREKPDGFQFLADVHLQFPDVMLLAISDVKINNDDERSLWSASVLDLGASAVIFPPLTKPVLEEVIGQMMTVVLERTRPGWQPPESHQALPEPVIDLAEEGLVE